MRLASAADEILPLEDPRVKMNRAYLVILLLSQVVVRLGDLREEDIGPRVIEGLFSADLAYLQGFYKKINGLVEEQHVCPHCGRPVHLEALSSARRGGSESPPAQKDLPR